MYTLILLITITNGVGMGGANITSQKIEGYESLEQCKRALSDVYVMKDDSKDYKYQGICIPSPTKK